MNITIDDAKLILAAFNYCEYDGVLNADDADLCGRIFSSFPSLTAKYRHLASEFL